jgi:hypothetical protein
MLWFEHGLEDGEGCDLHGLWLVILEFAKDLDQVNLNERF